MRSSHTFRCIDNSGPGSNLEGTFHDGALEHRWRSYLATANSLTRWVHIPDLSPLPSEELMGSHMGCRCSGSYGCLATCNPGAHGFTPHFKQVTIRLFPLSSSIAVPPLFFPRVVSLLGYGGRECCCFRSPFFYVLWCQFHGILILFVPSAKWLFPYPPSNMPHESKERTAQRSSLGN